MNDILTFLTGGAFNTLKELLTNIFQYIVTLITNLLTFILSPILNFIDGIIPNIGALNTYVNYVLDYISPYVNYVLDLTFLSSPILTYLVLSIIFRVLLRSSTYIQKVLVQWYEKLTP